MSTTIRLAKDRAEKQLQKARDAREMDTTRRNINKMTSQLTQMLEKPSEKGYVPEYLLERFGPWLLWPTMPLATARRRHS